MVCIEFERLSLFVAADGLAVAAERAELRATWGASDQRGAMAFPRLIGDRSPEVLVVFGASVTRLVVGNAAPQLLVLGDSSKGLDDEGEDESDREGADDDKDQAGEDLYPERVIPAHEEDAEGDAAQKRQCRADVIADKSIELGHGPLLSPPRPHER